MFPICLEQKVHALFCRGEYWILISKAIQVKKPHSLEASLQAKLFCYWVLFLPVVVQFYLVLVSKLLKCITLIANSIFIYLLAFLLIFNRSANHWYKLAWLYYVAADLGCSINFSYYIPSQVGASNSLPTPPSLRPSCSALALVGHCLKGNILGKLWYNFVWFS